MHDTDANDVLGVILDREGEKVILYNGKDILVHIMPIVLMQFSPLTSKLFQFNVPFKITLAHIRRVNQQVGQKYENPEKKQLPHPKAELSSSQMCPV